MSSDSQPNQQAEPPQESPWKTPPRQAAGVASDASPLNNNDNLSPTLIKSKPKGTLEPSTNRVLNSSNIAHRYSQKRAQVVFGTSSPGGGAASVLDNSFVSTTSSATTVARVNSTSIARRKLGDSKAYISAIVRKKAPLIENKLEKKEEEQQQQQYQCHLEEEELENSQGALTTEVPPQIPQDTIPETPKRSPTTSSILPPTHPSTKETSAAAGIDNDDEDENNIMVATTPRTSHRRHHHEQQGRPINTGAHPEGGVVQSVEQAKQLLQQHQQQHQRQLQQLQQDHYQQAAVNHTASINTDINNKKTSSPNKDANINGATAAGNTDSGTKQKERTFQQQYMEQQAQLDRETSAYDQNHRNSMRRRPASPDDLLHGGTAALPQAKLVGAATAMSTHFTFAMNKFQEMLQPSSNAFGSNSRLIYTATSESFTSSLAADGEEKKAADDDDEEEYDDEDAVLDDEHVGCSLYGSSSSPRHHINNRSQKKKKRKKKASRQHRDLVASPSAASSVFSYAGTSISSSVTGPTKAGSGSHHAGVHRRGPPKISQNQSAIISMVEEISPMMRMRNQEAQHAVEISASSSEQTSNYMAPATPNKNEGGTRTATTKQRQMKENKNQPKKSSLKKTVPTKQSSDDSLIHAQPSTASSYKTEEQVKAEKQRKWKRKMKLAQKQRQQEQAELGDDIVGGSYSTSIDDDEQDDETVDLWAVDDDDASQMSYGCQPGSNLVEIWASISGIDPPSRSTIKAAAKSPVEVLQKIVSARCGELREVSSSEAEEEEDDDEGFSFSDDENEVRTSKKHGSAKVEGVKPQSRGRGGKSDRRGRSRRPRSKSPYSIASQVSRHSQSSRTSRHSETSIGDILDRMVEDEIKGRSASEGDERPDPRAQRDELELKLLQEKPNFRILGKHLKGKEEERSKSDETSKVAETSKAMDHKAAETVVSADTSVTPLAGTTGGSVLSGNAGNDSLVSGSAASNNNADTAKSQGPISSILSDGSKKSNVSKTSLHSLKSVSFDETTIVKTSPKASIPTISNLEKSDPNFIKSFVAGLGHHGVPLLWHKAPTAAEPAGSSESSAGSAPSCVHPESIRAYLKIQSARSTSGTLDGFGDTSPTSTIDIPAAWDSPRLVWYQESNSGEPQKSELGHIDLFDIASIETASTMSASFLQVLEAFPYSMSSRTLVIQLNRPSNHSMHSTHPDWFFPSSTTVESTTQAPLYNMIVLEAMNEDDAKTLVLGIKWMVARLSFNLIVGNLSISCEMLRPEQQQDRSLGPVAGDSATIGSGGDEDSMGPRRLPMVRRTKVMNDITFHMVDRVLEKTSRFQQGKRNEPDDFLKQQDHEAVPHEAVPTAIAEKK